MRYILLVILYFIINPESYKSQELILKSIDVLDDLSVKEMVMGTSGELAIIEDQRLLIFDGYELELKWTLDSATDRLKELFLMDEVFYIGTSEGRVLMLKEGKVSTVIVYDHLRVNSIIPLQDKKILIATEGQGMHLLEPFTGKTVELQLGDNLDHVNEVVRMKDKYYYATDLGLFTSTLDFDSIRSIKALDQRLIDHLIGTAQGDLWMNDFYGNILRLDADDLSISEFSIDANLKVTDLAYADERLFVGSQKGMFQVDFISSEKPLINQVSQGSCEELLVDDECNLWVAKEGSVQRASLYFSRFTQSQEMEIHSMSIFKDRLLLGTEKGIIDFDTQRHMAHNLDLDLNITCMGHSPSRLAVGTYDSGVLLFSSGSPVPFFFGKKEGLRDNTVLALEFVDENTLIVSTLGGVDILKEEKGKWHAQALDEDLDTFYILSIFSSNDGSIWFGTDRKGVIHYYQGKARLVDMTSTGKMIGTVSSIRQGEDNRVWLISEELGLLNYSSKGLSEEESPHGEWGAYTSLISLNSDRFLLVGEREVSIYDPLKKELIQFGTELELERGTSFLNNYTVSGKEVYFEHNRTLYLFHDIKDVARTNSLTSLLSVEVDLEPRDTTIHDFSEFENSFQFTYSGILHRNQEEVQYSYRLEGFDDTWRMTKDRQVAYAHLSPGTYTFQVRSSHDIFHAGADPISYSFTIHRAFYRTLWFRTMVVLLLLTMIYWWRSRGLKAKELKDKYALLSTETKLLNLKSQLNPHFLFNSFNTVIGLIEEDPERSVKYVEHLTDFYRKVLDLGDSDLIPISKEIELLSAYINLLSERFGDALEIHVQESFSKFFIPPMSLQLLVENAVKHNVAIDARPLVIEIFEAERSIVVKNGFDPRTSVKDSMGIGLENLKQRFHLLAQKELVINKVDGYFIVELPKIFKDQD